MGPELRARRQNIRIIISEVVMVMAVIAMVSILALLVSGYWLNSDFEVERQGMLQIYSVPTGASVEVDGESPWFQRTNTSKILSSGKHNITLTKDGYDSWSKTIEISEGLLYRLGYPHLFLKDRVKETVYDTATTTFATFSPDRKSLLLVNNTTAWQLINLDSDVLKSTTLDIAKLFSETSSAIENTSPDVFNGTIMSADWDSSNGHVLLKVSLGSDIEWVLLDVKNVAKSINLTDEFAANFDEVSIFDNSANTLVAVREGNLHKIDIDARQISAVIAKNVASYDFYDSEVAYISDGSVKLIKNFTGEPKVIGSVESSAQVLFSKFYDNKYVFIIEQNIVNVYQKENLELYFTAEISFIPTTVKIGPDGEFVSMNSGDNFAALDMESMQIVEWSPDTEHFGWLNGHMLYAVNDGVLSVYDFDGLNHRVLASNVSERFPATITNDKWLYYFSDGQLVREWLVAK